MRVDLTLIEKQALIIFLGMYEKKAPVILLGANELGSALKLSRPRAYAIMKQLESKEILTKYGRKGFIPTELGEKVIKSLSFRHKILEHFFYTELGMKLEQAHVESFNLVLHVSDTLIECIAKKINYPETCPHNIEIPYNNFDISIIDTELKKINKQ